MSVYIHPEKFPPVKQFECPRETTQTDCMWGRRNNMSHKAVNVLRRLAEHSDVLINLPQ